MAYLSEFSGEYIQAAQRSKYDVKSYTFPEDLFSAGVAKYADSWVMININVNGQGKMGYRGQGEPTENLVQLDDLEKRRFTNFDARKQTAAGAATSLTASAAAVGGASQFSLSKIIANPAQAGKAVAKGAVSGAVTGGAASIPILAAGTAQRETKRLKAAIQFPMPNSLQTGYSVDWGESDTKLLDLMLRAPGLGANAVKNLFAGDMSAAAASGKQAADAAASLSLGTQSAFGSGGISAMTGLASNPKKEMIMNGVNFRTFTMDYKFYPKSKAEMVKLDAIIAGLKYHMHPEYKSEGQYTFIYPSEFDITFYVSSNENIWINKIATCVLTDLRINWTPDAVWAAHEDGAPNAITVSMTFRELSIQTKESIEKGY